MIPVMVSTWIQPVNQLLSTRFATHLFDGAGASAMDYANTLYTILTGVLVLSITNVLFPEMSRLSSAGQEEELGALLDTNLRGMLFLLIPLTAGVMLMAEPLVRLLYQWGSWDGFSTTITARALCFMSLGMVGYGLQNVLSRSFYAGQDGKTPVVSGIVSIAVNLILCLLLTEPLDVAGLSLATALSATAGAVVLLIPTLRRFPSLRTGAFWFSVGKMLLCTLVMAAVVALIHGLLAGMIPDSLIGRAALLGMPTIFGVAVYFILARLLKLPELGMLIQMFKK
jgi:putative peptidoglycan lipid II flippase